MNKRHCLMASVIIVSTSFLCQVRASESEEVTVIRYEVIIVKDKKSDSTAWDEAVRQVTSLNLDNDVLFVQDMCKTIEQTCKRSGSGIHAQVNVTLGNGICPKGCCGSECACLDQYDGICPCSTRSLKGCQKAERPCCASN